MDAQTVTPAPGAFLPREKTTARRWRRRALRWVAVAMLPPAVIGGLFCGCGFVLSCAFSGNDWSTTNPTREQIQHTEWYLGIDMADVPVERISIEWQEFIDDSCELELWLTPAAWQRFSAQNAWSASDTSFSDPRYRHWSLTRTTNGRWIVVRIHRFTT